MVGKDSWDVNSGADGMWRFGGGYVMKKWPVPVGRPEEAAPRDGAAIFLA
jgi:hypothetical protein